jgi:arylsulfatase A-like enzyme
LILFGVIAPLASMSLLLRALRIVALPEARRPSDLVQLLALFGSDVCTYGALALVAWTLVSSSGRRGLPAFQVLGALSWFLELVHHSFWLQTGWMLGGDVIRAFFTHLDTVGPVVTSEVGPGSVLALIAGVATMGLLPAVLRRRGGPGLPPSSPKHRVVYGLAALVAAAGSTIDLQTPAGTLFARNATVHLLGSLAQPPPSRVATDRSPLPAAKLALGPQNAGSTVTPPNLVVVILESVGLGATTLGNPGLATTPRLAQLARSSVVATRAYAVVPHTSKALVALMCGVEPAPDVEVIEAQVGLPARCLAELLADVGYRSVFLQPAHEHFEDRRALVHAMGFDDFLPGNLLDSTGFERANYFGYEDQVLLEPSARWLADAQQPFLATYLTLAPHHDYQTVSRYEHLALDAEDAEHDRYLNAVRYLDFFLAELLDQYRQLGLLDDTLFLVVGDHGEAFGEHGLQGHNNVLYDEVLRVPWLLYDPTGRLPARSVSWPIHHLDALPTLVDAAGLVATEGAFRGVSMLGEEPDPRTLRAQCWYPRRCAAAIHQGHKWLHHYDWREPEAFSLQDDPFETRNLLSSEEAISIGPEAARQSRDLTLWETQVRGWYTFESAEP